MTRSIKNLIYLGAFCGLLWLSSCTQQTDSSSSQSSETPTAQTDSDLNAQDAINAQRVEAYQAAQENLKESVGYRPTTLTITRPLDKAKIALGTRIEIVAESPQPGELRDIRFYANQKQIGSDQSPPYRINWFPTTRGEYYLKVEARARKSHNVSDAIYVVVY